MVFEWYRQDGGCTQVGCKANEIKQSFKYLVQLTAEKSGFRDKATAFADTIADAIRPSRLLGFHGSPDENTYAAQRTEWLNQLESEVMAFIEVYDCGGDKLRKLQADKDLKFADMKAREDLIRKYKSESRLGEAEYEETILAGLSKE